MMPQSTPSTEQMRHIEYVQQRYEDYLLSKPHVVGIGIGYAHRDGQPTAEIAVVVMVDRKVPPQVLAPADRIPTQLEGVRVDVQEMGQFSAQSGLSAENPSA